MPSILHMLLLAAVATSTLEDVTLTLDVKKGGDLRWKNDTCQADLIDKDGVVTHADTTTSLVVAPGVIDIVVACAAQEGTLKKTVRVNARSDQTLTVVFTPGFLTATIQRDERLSAGDVIVYDGFDHEVARGSDRTVLALDAGAVRVVGVVDKSTAGTSRDVRGERRATVRAGQKTELKIDASDGELIVNVVENGSPAKALVALREPGNSNRVLEITPGVATSVPSGTWDLVSQLEEAHDFREQLTKGIVVTGGKTTTKQLSHSTGRLLPVVAVPAGVVVDLLIPGADKAFNQIDPNTEARLTPGRYVVRATRDVTLDDGTKPVALAPVTIAGGSTARVTLSPAVAHVEVEVRVGGEARPLQVDLTLPGAAAPLVSHSADGAGKTAFDLAPQVVTVSTSLSTAHGPLHVKKQLTLKPGVNRVRLDIDVGHVIVQVIDAGAAVAGDVMYFQRLKKGQPDGVPVVSVKAGEEAFLAPGIYVLVVKRKGEQRLFGEVRVASGRVVERALDWSPRVDAASPRVKPQTEKTTTDDSQKKKADLSKAVGVPKPDSTSTDVKSEAKSVDVAAPK